MIHRARLHILPLIAVTAGAVLLTACAADFAASAWPLRFAFAAFSLCIAAAPAYWLGPSAETAFLQRLRSSIDAALRDHERGCVAGHEMKTPLTGIKAYLELLADGDADDEVTRAEFLAGIGSQVDRLERTIDELLAPVGGRAASGPAPAQDGSRETAAASST